MVNFIYVLCTKQYFLENNISFINLANTNFAFIYLFITAKVMFEIRITTRVLRIEFLSINCNLVKALVFMIVLPYAFGQSFLERTCYNQGSSAWMFIVMCDIRMYMLKVDCVFHCNQF